MRQTYISTFLAIQCPALRSSVFFSVSPQPGLSIWWFLTQWSKSCEDCPCIWKFSFSIHVPVIINMFVQQYLKWRLCCPGISMYFSGIGNDSSVGTYSLTRSSTWWRLMKYPMTVLKWSWRRPVWFSSKIVLFFSSVWAVPDEGGCSQILISSRKFDCSNCDWETLPLHWAFGHGVQMCPYPPILQCLRPLCLLSRFSRARPNWCSLERSLAEMGWYSTIVPTRITGPLNGSPKRLSYGVFPSDKRSVTFRR